MNSRDKSNNSSSGRKTSAFRCERVREWRRGRGRGGSASVVILVALSLRGKCVRVFMTSSSTFALRIRAGNGQDG